MEVVIAAPTKRYDVAVVGAGPAGAACAYWLAEAGHDVVVVEKKHFPRVKTCGDGLTPRSVKQLNDMGLADDLRKHHRYEGLRSLAFGKTLELKWPTVAGMPDYGYVVTRHDLDHLVASRAVKGGATLLEGHEATTPILRQGLMTGLVATDKDRGATREINARYVVVADGANSRFGRALGTSRDRIRPMGMAIRGYYTSPLHDDPWIESCLDIRDKQGNSLPGYGWIFPVGDGRVNVGIGLLSTFNQWKDVNTTHLLNAYVDSAPSYWGISPETACGPATGGRLPMALAVGPHVGPTHVVVGDAGGAINPFNGEGIAYAYETGRMAAEAVGEALRTGNGMALQGYGDRLQTEYGLYYRVARAFVHVIGKPELMRALVATGMHSRTLMEWVLRIMANLLRPDELGPAEAVYRAVARIAGVLPEAV